MNIYRTIAGTYGSNKTPCMVHCMDTRHGTWYAVDGSVNANLFDTDEVVDGVDVEGLQDWDTCTMGSPVTCPEDLEDC